MVHWRLILLLLPLLGLAVLPAPQAAQAQGSTPACLVAAQAAMSMQGAIYSQGGYHPNDPVDAGGNFYSRTGPNSFDCSGLVWWAYQQADVSVGWTTYQQVNDGSRTGCSLADLNGAATSCWAPGDLIFLSYAGGQHVAMYIGNGLFMDCYNHASGCILHDVIRNRFYQSNVWQARRVVSGCEGTTFDGQVVVDTPTGVIPFEYPTWEATPDLVQYIGWTVNQCDECTEDGVPVIDRLTPEERQQRSDELRPTSSDWVSWYVYTSPVIGEFGPFPMLDPVNGFAKIFNWLRFWIWEYFIELFCWLLTLLQMLINFLSMAINTVLYLLNHAWRFLLFAWITVRQWVLILWGWLGDALQFFAWLQAAAVWVWAFLTALWDVFLVILSLLGSLILMWLALVGQFLGMLGFVVGLVLGLLLDLLATLRSTLIPAQLDGYTHGAYYILRGILDAIHESPLAWIMYLCYALVNLSFLVWLTWFLPTSGGDA